MPLKVPGRRKFAQLVSHHVLGDVHRNKFLAVVHRDRVSHEFRQDCGAPRPRAYHLLLVGGVQRVHLFFQVRVGKWPFFYGATHSYLFLLLRVTIHLSVRLLLRVLKPRVGWPHGVTGCRPPDVLPSPPPCGWSTGFMATPRLCGDLPSHRLRPALPNETFLCSMLPSWPTVAMQFTATLRISPEGILTCA